MKNFRILLLISFISIFIFNCGGNYAPLETVEYVDIQKYLGKWYEIALLPNRFEEGCHCTTAEYSLIDSETLRVTNTCNEDSADGEIDQVNGKAFVVEGSNNAKLKVQFFWPFKGDYWILELDDDYQYALVGSPSREYLWILSRTPLLDEKIIQQLKEVADRKGFDSSKMIVTDQSCYQ
ncbi:MAG: lipocalin family protein [Melioribacteraceae bacterium]|nr:MAG: lipocalin family protein [Melioribacteraceae bacterium]